MGIAFILDRFLHYILGVPDYRYGIDWLIDFLVFFIVHDPGRLYLFPVCFASNLLGHIRRLVKLELWNDTDEV